jgi:hypothetical protein
MREMDTFISLLFSLELEFPDRPKHRLLPLPPFKTNNYNKNAGSIIPIEWVYY